MQIAVLAIISAIACLIIRNYVGGLATALSIAGFLVILLLSSSRLEPILAVIQRLRDLSGLSDAATAPMLKATGLGLLTHLAGAVCEDSGELTLKKAVEISSTIVAVYISLPLLIAIIDLLEELLRG